MSDQQSRQGKSRAGRAPQGASERDAQWPPDQLPNPTENTSLTSPGPPPAAAVEGAPPTGRQTQGGSGGNARPASGTTGTEWPPDQLPNPTANTSLTSPGPPPDAAAAGAPPSPPALGRQTRGNAGAAPGQPMAATRSGATLQPGDVIPWDPTGKLDDEVERRTAGPAPATGGAPGTLGEAVSPNRYAGATDAAPTSPPAGATTTLGGMTGTEEAAESSGAPGYFPNEEAPSGYPEGHGEVY